MPIAPPLEIRYLMNFPPMEKKEAHWCFKMKKAQQESCQA
jgi:hypothetical protein